MSDLAFADPAWLPYPVQLFGRLVAWGEKAARGMARSPRALKIAGFVVAFAIPALAGVGCWFFLELTEKLSRMMEYGCAVYFAYSTLSVRGLDQAGKKIIDDLEQRFG